ncbi:cyclic nucleotide-binding domain-containing protein [Rhodobacteraceae bacterium HSP-20]|uniref:Cyclic nucleotide-binding domain-containing protein n=1 Tax=Paragemmobacter amnigenus TaxID=2852097 RepID=A0ABS6J5K5_9RHOB|nr:cyclic nucleotide-binding domain-containing protein [Rhodobacter amnigenus]MBU9697665.1 cyclic nucleotide-binding domain-containing protein [Rhodobacter amnigenus]MBV4388892.1 cyclic nucleotide-binding domain-containing protein [Rhodobacter amnigenus]
MRPSDLPEIRHLPLFRDMLQANFEQLMQGAYAQSFPEGLMLIRQGDPADFLHIVVEGMVELFAEWKGRSASMTVVQPVGTFILAACIRDAPYLMSARTLERSRIIMIPASDLRAVFRRDVEFAVSTINELATCYRAVVRHAKGLKLRDSRERVAAYLLKRAAQAGQAEFDLGIEKRVIASMLGMTPENLSRALKSLAEDGVRVQGQRVTLWDRARLLPVAQPDPLLDGPG